MEIYEDARAMAKPFLWRKTLLLEQRRAQGRNSALKIDE
jgi:hypothetical protein